MHTALVSFAGRGIIETPLEEVAAFIKDLESSFIWKKFITVSYSCSILQAGYYRNFVIKILHLPKLNRQKFTM